MRSLRRLSHLILTSHPPPSSSPLPLIPLPQVKKWRQDIRAQERALERQLRGIEAEELKVKKSLKALAKRGDKKACMTLAKELVRSKRHKERLYTSKAQLNSIVMQLNHQLCECFFLVTATGRCRELHMGALLLFSCLIYPLMENYNDYSLATLKIAGVLQKSSEIMKLVNQVVRLPEISQAMQEMSMEMMKVRTRF